jgi:hypothetical protein
MVKGQTVSSVLRGPVIGYVDGRGREFRLLPGPCWRYYGFMLNGAQLMCFCCGILVAIVMGLCPPRTQDGHFAGYGALWHRPGSRSRISVARLLMQWLILTGVTYAAILAVPQMRHVAHFLVPSQRTVAPATGRFGAAIERAFRRAAQ